MTSPDDTKTFEHGKVGVVTLGGFTAPRLVLEPGWKRSKNFKPTRGTDS